MRPEDVTMLEEERLAEDDLNRVEGQVRFASYMGSLIRYEVATKNGEVFKIDVRNPREHKIVPEGRHVTFIQTDSHIGNTAGIELANICLNVRQHCKHCISKLQR